MDKSQAMSMLNCTVDDNLNITPNTSTVCSNGNVWGGNGDDLSCWGYYHQSYYPNVIRESYPVYLQERAKDKGKQAFEIIKILKDKKLVQLKTVGNFIDLMDELIKIL